MEDLQKKFESALARIAALESQQSRTPKSPEFDAAKFAQALTADPVGTMTRFGVPVEHVSKILVAHALGDQAPSELRMLAQMGPQVSAVQALASDLQAVRQRQEQIEERDRKSALQSSFNALAVDKAKYPFLAAVMVKTPDLIKSDLESHKGDAAALASSLEDRYKSIAGAAGYVPPASSENAEPAPGQSTQAKQAQPGAGIDQTPPPLPQSQTKVGLFTREDHEKLRDEVIRKYGS